jgi:cyclopropane fatty-acyl-phospholipid synthase-like methyltransferase
MSGKGTEGCIPRIIRAYRPDGPFRVFPPAYLKKLYRQRGLDPKTPHPWVFDAEAMSHFRQEGVKRLFAAMELGPRCKVLSLGEGNGAPSRLLAKLYGCRVTGVDVSPLQTANAKGCAALHGVERLVDYVLQDVHDLDLGRRRFDRLYDNESAIHWRDKEAVLARAARFLKPRSLAGFNEWLSGDQGDLDAAWRRFPEFRRMYDQGIWFQVTLREFCAILKRAGFEVLQAEELTDEVDDVSRRRLAVLERLRGSLDEGSRCGIPYFRAMLKTHGRYLRYGRIIARAPAP